MKLLVKKRKSLLGFGRAVCAQTVGPSWALHGLRQMPEGPEEDAMGVGCSQPFFWLLKCSGPLYPVHGMPVKAVTGCKCRKLSPCVGGSCGLGGVWKQERVDSPASLVWKNPSSSTAPSHPVPWCFCCKGVSHYHMSPCFGC